MKINLFLWMTLMVAFVANAQYRTAITADNIKTLQVYHAHSWEKAPVINFSGGEQVHIAFDEMSHDYYRFAYRIVHCNADWTKSSMIGMEYMEGFMENDIEDYTTSQGTFQGYTHYDLYLPNENVQLKISGNYAVEIYDKDEDEAVVLTACFSVLDASVKIDAEVSTTTDLGYNQSYQQVEFDVKTSMGQIDRPESDLKVLVRQNRRIDNEVFGVSPLMVGSDLIQYRHRPELVFEAGNEYRRCGFTTFKYAGLGVDRIAYERPFYQVYLFDAEPRLSGYTYDEDQNGRFYIHTLQAMDDTQSEADYFEVHFRLPMAQPLKDDVYVIGDFTDGRFDDSNRMVYDEADKAYRLSLFLKQGVYNYLYAVLGRSGGSRAAVSGGSRVSAGGSRAAVSGATSVSARRGAELAPIEGNYWATENEYQIFVYYRPVGAQYDALIGYSEVDCHPSNK